MNDILSTTNYVEWYLIKPIATDSIESKESVDIYDINLTEEYFLNVLSRLKNPEYKDFKFFQREYKEYTYDDLCCQAHTNDEVKVFKISNIKAIPDNNILKVESHRTKMTLLNFPSTKDIQQISYVKQLIFRVSNRIYINFKVSIDDLTKQKTYSVYVNYNHDGNVDTNMINDQLKSVLKVLL